MHRYSVILVDGELAIKWEDETRAEAIDRAGAGAARAECALRRVRRETEAALGSRHPSPAQELGAILPGQDEHDGQYGQRRAAPVDEPGNGHGARHSGRSPQHEVERPPFVDAEVSDQSGPQIGLQAKGRDSHQEDQGDDR